MEASRPQSPPNRRSPGPTGPPPNYVPPPATPPTRQHASQKTDDPADAEVAAAAEGEGGGDEEEWETEGDDDDDDDEYEDGLVTSSDDDSTFQTPMKSAMKTVLDSSTAFEAEEGGGGAAGAEAPGERDVHFTLDFSSLTLERFGQRERRTLLAHLAATLDLTTTLGLDGASHEAGTDDADINGIVAIRTVRAGSVVVELAVTGIPFDSHVGNVLDRLHEAGASLAPEDFGPVRLSGVAVGGRPLDYGASPADYAVDYDEPEPKSLESLEFPEPESSELGKNGDGKEGMELDGVAEGNAAVPAALRVR